MDKIKILIVEDDIITANDIAQRLETEGYEITAIVDNGYEALELVKTKQPDIALLDIGLGKDKMDGIETAGKINKIRQMPFIFLTAYVDKGTINRAMEAMPASYLVKPVNDRQLIVSINLAMTNYANSISQKYTEKSGKAADHFFHNNCLFVKTDMFVKVELSTILWIEACSNYSIIVTSHHKYTVLAPLHIFIGKLRENDSSFLRIHRSFGINIQKIDSFDLIHVKIDKKEIPIGKSYRDEFYEQIGFVKSVRL